jgi:transglutaminase-like putative cysteine protease
LYSLLLSMFPTTGAVVGDVPEDTETSDPANDPDLLAEAMDHWWVEAYVDGSWVAMDPSFSYAEPGQTFATPLPTGEGPGA